MTDSRQRPPPHAVPGQCFGARPEAPPEGSSSRNAPQRKAAETAGRDPGHTEVSLGPDPELPLLPGNVPTVDQAWRRGHAFNEGSLLRADIAAMTNADGTWRTGHTGLPRAACQGPAGSPRHATAPSETERRGRNVLASPRKATRTMVLGDVGSVKDGVI